MFTFYSWLKSGRVVLNSRRHCRPQVCDVNLIPTTSTKIGLQESDSRRKSDLNVFPTFSLNGPQFCKLKRLTQQKPPRTMSNGGLFFLIWKSCEGHSLCPNVVLDVRLFYKDVLVGVQWIIATSHLPSFELCLLNDKHWMLWPVQAAKEEIISDIVEVLI